MRILKSTAAATGIAALMLLGACAHHDATAQKSDYTHVDQAATTGSVEGTSTTPAVIPGPAKVDSDGNLYTSSAAPGTGNASATGTNTNVSVVPKRGESTTSVAYVPAEPAPTPVVVVETPAPVAVVETPTMTSSSTVQETTTRRRMAKD